MAGNVGIRRLVPKWRSQGSGKRLDSAANWVGCWSLIVYYYSNLIFSTSCAAKRQESSPADKSFALWRKSPPSARRFARCQTLDRLSPRAGMNFRLRQNRGLRPESLHQRAAKAGSRRGDQYRGLAFAGRLFEAVTHRGHELGQLEGCMARLRSSPGRSAIRRRPAPISPTARSAAGSRCGMYSARRSAAPAGHERVRPSSTGLREKPVRPAMPSRMVDRSRIEIRSASNSCSTRWDARHRDLARHDVLDQLALFLRQILQEFLHSP